MWIARDKNGNLNLFYHKPIRNNDFCVWLEVEDNFINYDDQTAFPELTWEDEPIEVVLFPVDITHLMPMTETSKQLNKLPFPCQVCSNAKCLIPRGSDACKHYNERLNIKEQ